jgi:hypothetical protein
MSAEKNEPSWRLSPPSIVALLDSFETDVVLAAGLAVIAHVVELRTGIRLVSELNAGEDKLKQPFPEEVHILAALK